MANSSSPAPPPQEAVAGGDPWGAARDHDRVQEEEAEGCQDVCLRDCVLRYLLASLPRLLHLLLPQPRGEGFDRLKTLSSINNHLTNY